MQLANEYAKLPIFAESDFSSMPRHAFVFAQFLQLLTH
jgi:hypothetical protein